MKDVKNYDPFSYICNRYIWDVEKIEDNKTTLEHYLKELFPHSEIQFIKTPDITIDKQTGSVIKDDVLDITTKKILSVYHCAFDREQINKVTDKYIYIYSMEGGNSSDELSDDELRHRFVGKNEIGFRMAVYNPNKKQATFTIDAGICERFQKISKKMAINKSMFVENKIAEFLEKNE